MRAVFVLLFQCFCLGSILGSDNIPTYIFEKEIDWNLFLSDSLKVFLDPEGAYDINAVLNLEARQFEILIPEEKTKGAVTAWSRIRLRNATDKPLYHYFHFCNRSESITTYTVVNGEVKDKQHTGFVVPPGEKYLPAAQNYILYNLDVGEEKEFYFETYFPTVIEQSHLAELFVKPAQALIHFLFGKYTSQALYAGIMILFGLVSLFMYGMFRERVFIYFTLVMFFFLGYFMAMFGIVDVLFTYRYPGLYYTQQQIFISGIVASFSLFVSRYLELKKHFPRYVRLYIYFYVFVALFPHLVGLVLGYRILVAIASNIFVSLWILFTVAFIIRQAYKGHKAGKILFTSITILTLGSLIQILLGSDILPWTMFTQHAMQIGSVLFSGVLFYGLFERINRIRNEKQRFEELDQLKSHFFANISHEFRTPLTLVMGPVQQMLETEEKPKNKQLLGLAHRNAERLLELINQLLDLSKLEAGKMELNIQKCEVKPFLRRVVMSFESLAQQKDIRLNLVNPQEDTVLYLDQAKMEQIFYNLLSNAFKFTENGGEVSVILVDKAKHVEISIQDTGIGILTERLPYIFNRFYQVDSSETREQEGTGIGLALVKELVQLHQGEIGVRSIVDEGTTFTLSLLKGKTHFQAEDFVPENEYTDNERIRVSWKESYQSTELQLGADTQDTIDLPRVLIIEDNADVRTYIRQHLVSSFRILEAINGQEGIEAALEYQPDLVISDVMMPIKNGYEVCKVLKSDTRTSHIPIILLTAKAAQEEKIQGLETGADDYLIKPFDTQELSVRVQNLIETRRQLRQRFAESTVFEPQQPGLNSVDQAFLEKIGAIVEKHLTDEQFSVEVLAKEMGMSRVHLNRKLKALTDESANKFIRSFRLQRALKLLQNREGNVSEVAFATGFSSTAYFVKCFGDKFGKTPGAILQK